MSEPTVRRNPELPSRIVSGITLAVLFLGVTFWLPSDVIVPVLAGICALAQVEFYAIMRAAGIPVFRYVATLGGALWIAATFLGPILLPAAGQVHAAESVVIGVILITLFLRQFPERDDPHPLLTIGATLFGLFYVAGLFNFITRLVLVHNDGEYTTGRALALYLILTVKLTDVGAFFTGSYFGRHKLFPRLSPRKTWEGLAGGIALAVLASVGYRHCTRGMLGDMPFPLHHALILGFVMAVIGTLGDMFESLIKRAAQLKDSSNTVPGMGGVLDVLDSLLFGAPALYIYTVIFLA